MNCPKCGTPLPDDSKFCGFCGASIEEEQLTRLIDESENYPAPFRAEETPQPQPINDGYDRYSENAARRPQGRGGYVIGDGYYDGAQKTAVRQEEPKKKSKKPLIITIIALVLVAAIVTGVIILVSNHVSEAELQEAREQFLPPAQAVKLDLSQDDPSNDDIKFTYDSHGRIANCTYKANNKAYRLDYNYHKSDVDITVSYKKHDILTKKIEYKKIGESNKFIDVDGYIVRLGPEDLEEHGEEVTSAPTQAATLVPTDAPTQAPTAEPTEKPTEKSGGEEFIALYKEYLNNTDFPYTEFCLLYLNDDDIPEMLMIEGSKYQRRSDIHTARLCWIENGAVHDSGDTISSMHAYMYYIERGGLLRISGGSGRASGTYIYEFDGSNFSTEIGYAALNTDTGTEYTVNGETVSEERFNEVMEEYPVDTEIPYGANEEEMEMYFSEFTHPA